MQCFNTKMCFGKAVQILLTSIVLGVKLTSIGFQAICQKSRLWKTAKSLVKIKKTFYCSLPNIKYELHESLWNLKLKVYLKLKTCLLNHPRRIQCFFICLSFTVRRKSVKGCFWLDLSHLSIVALKSVRNPFYPHKGLRTRHKKASTNGNKCY